MGVGTGNHEALLLEAGLLLQALHDFFVGRLRYPTIIQRHQNRGAFCIRTNGQRLGPQLLLDAH